MRRVSKSTYYDLEEDEFDEYVKDYLYDTESIAVAKEEYERYDLSRDAWLEEHSDYLNDIYKNVASDFNNPTATGVITVNRFLEFSPYLKK